MSPPRRRSLMDAARDPLTAKQASASRKPSLRGRESAARMPVLLKVAIGLVIGFTSGFLVGRFGRWI